MMGNRSNALKNAGKTTSAAEPHPDSVLPSEMTDKEASDIADDIKMMEAERQKRAERAKARGLDTTSRRPASRATSRSSNRVKTADGGGGGGGGDRSGAVDVAAGAAAGTNTNMKSNQRWRVNGAKVRPMAAGRCHTCQDKCSCWIKVSRLISDFVYHPYFSNFITFVIVLAGILVGWQTYHECEEDTTTAAIECPFNPYDSVFTALDRIILTIFSIEALLKLCTSGFEFWNYFGKAWNVFDFTIVVASYLMGSGAASALRLLRLLRVLKLVRAVPQLQVILSGLLAGMTSIGYILLLLVLVFYLFGILCMVMFKENDELHFEHVFLTLLSLFRMATLEDWTDIMYTNMFTCDKYGYSQFLTGSETGSQMGDLEFPLRCDCPLTPLPLRTPFRT